MQETMMKSEGLSADIIFEGVVTEPTRFDKFFRLTVDATVVNVGTHTGGAHSAGYWEKGIRGTHEYHYDKEGIVLPIFKGDKIRGYCDLHGVQLRAIELLDEEGQVRATYRATYRKAWHGE